MTPGQTGNETTVLSLLANRIPLNTRYIAQSIQSASFSLTATGVVVAAVAGSRVKVFSAKLVVSAALTVNWQDGTGGGAVALEGAMSYAANGGAVEVVDPPFFLFTTSYGNGLYLAISGAGTAAGRISYWLEDPSVSA